jgi:hypothetical protein
VAEYRSLALDRARQYSWEAVTDQYEQLLTAVCEAQGPGPLPAFLVDREPVAV